MSTYLALSMDPNLFRPECNCIVNVTELPRFFPVNSSFSSVVEPKSCGCISQGSTRMDVNFPTNMANAGDMLNVTIVNDNTQCKRDVMKTKMELIATAFLQSDVGIQKELRSVVNQQIVGGKVHAGTASTIAASLDVPKNLANSTAIGTIVAYYYTLEISNELKSSCGSTKYGPAIKHHIYLKATKPIIDNRSKEETLPPDWAPIAASKRIFLEPSVVAVPVNPAIGATNRPYPPLVQQ